MAKKVANDYERTAEAIQKGLNVVVKRIYKNEGGYTLINADSTAQSGWVYLGGYEQELEGELDIPDVEDQVSEVLNYNWIPGQENALE